MKEMNLQDLLAPTWRERACAEDALMVELMDSSEDIMVWPEEIQDEIGALKPSPEVFLSALIAFWADVAENQYKKTMEGLQYAPLTIRKTGPALIPQLSP